MRLRVPMKCLELNRVFIIFYEVYNYRVNSCFPPVNKQKKDLRLSQGGGQTEFKFMKQKIQSDISGICCPGS
jgi:hypothetical protein